MLKKIKIPCLSFKDLLMGLWMKGVLRRDNLIFFVVNLFFFMFPYEGAPPPGACTGSLVGS